jgi:hypothetical protein
MTIAKKLSIALSLLFAGSASVLATTPITISPGGGDPTITVGSLGWNNGFAITTGNVGEGTPGDNPVGTVITSYGQGSLANFNNAMGGAIGGLHLNSTYQWSYVFGLTEVVASHTGTSPTDNVTLQTLAGPVNFFDVFEGPIAANPLQGTGFATGTLVLSGTFAPFNAMTGVGTSTFTATGIDDYGAGGTGAGGVDQFGTDNYPGVGTVAGAGALNELASISYANPTFFPTAPTLISVTANGFTNLAFQETDPASCYWTGAALSSALGPNVGGVGSPGACLVNTVGSLNGFSAGFSNTGFETRVTSAFNATAPEPGSIALMGLGLTALASFVRKRRQT